MRQDVLFRECQRFRQWWLWALLVLVTALFIVEVILADGSTARGDGALGVVGLSIALAMTILFVLLFAVSKLETEIRADGIYVRFFPFHLKFKTYLWRHLHSVTVRKYSPLAEYGGRGLRGFGKNRAFNISGDMGIQLITTRGARLLIGTRQPEVASEAIAKGFNKRSDAPANR
jgi:hypothetical protein